MIFVFSPGCWPRPKNILVHECSQLMYADRQAFVGPQAEAVCLEKSSECFRPLSWRWSGLVPSGFPWEGLVRVMPSSSSSLVLGCERREPRALGLLCTPAPANERRYGSGRSRCAYPSLAEFPFRSRLTRTRGPNGIVGKSNFHP